MLRALTSDDEEELEKFSVSLKRKTRHGGLSTSIANFINFLILTFFFIFFTPNNLHGPFMSAWIIARNRRQDQIPSLDILELN